MLRLLCVLTVASIAKYAECDVTSGFERIGDYLEDAGWDSLTDDELKAKPYWTDWINTGNSNIGTGDYENVRTILQKQPLGDGSCPLYCQKPVAVKWALVDETHKDDIEKCLVLNTEKFGQVKTMTYPGYNCLDAYQNDPTKADFCTKEKCIEIGMRKPNTRKRSLTCDQCPDMKVQYLCTDSEPAGGNCPSPSSRRSIGNNLDSQLEDLDEQIETQATKLSALEERANELTERKMREMNGENKLDELRSLLEKLLSDK